MKKYLNKFMLSIFMVVTSCITMVATTFAWVGLISNSSFDQFSLNVKENSEDDSDYGIELSLTGKKDSFDTSIKEIDLKRQILKNLGYQGVDKYSESLVNDKFLKHKIAQCTVSRNQYKNNKDLGDFYDMNGAPTTNYFKFDLYLSVYKIGDETASDSTNELDIYLRDHIFESETYAEVIINDIEYPSANPLDESSNIIPILRDDYNGVIPNPNSISVGHTVTKNAKVNVANSTRLAVVRHDAVEKYYTASSGAPAELTIYQNGSITPVYNSITDEYDFGGVLPKYYNFAVLYHNSIFPNVPLGDVPNTVLSRGDIQYKDDGVTNHVVKNGNGVTLSKMVQLTFYFWFEGWDADCFSVIDSKNVGVNLEFSTKSPTDV